MSVSMKDRKSVIYSEVERLRALLDQQDQRLRAQDEEIARLRAQPAAPAMAGCCWPCGGARIEMTRRLAVVCKATVKWDDELGFQQYKQGAWVSVPAHLVNCAAKGLEA